MATFWLLVRAVLIVAAGVLAGSWLEGVVRAALDRTGVDPVVREAASRTVRPVIVVVAVLIALAHVGLDATAAVAVTAAAVFAVGLSMREALANAAAGALLLTWRPYRAGDRVRIAGTSGVVIDLTLFATTLKTDQGVNVTVANRQVLENPVENHSRNGLLRADVVLRVAPAADIGKIGAAAFDAIAADERFAKEPAPALLAQGVTGDALELRLSAWVRAEDADAGRSALVLVARDALKKAKVELASAAR